MQAGGYSPPAPIPLSCHPKRATTYCFAFQKALKVEIVPKTDIITVQFRAKDPKLAADVVNSTVSSYTERNFRSSYDSATQVSSWLSKQMDDLKIKANQSQEKLAELQKQRGLIGGDETDNIVTKKLEGIDEQLTSAEADRIVKEARYRIAASGNPELIASMVPEPTLQVLRSQQAELRVEYARLNTKFGAGYPKLGELANEMTQVESAIDAELKNLSDRYKNEYLAAANAEKMLRAKFEEQKQKAYDLNQGAAQYAILKHEVDATQDLYQTLQFKLRQAGIVAGLASANIAVVEAGQVPSEPVDPRPVLDLLLGLGAGLGLGLLSALGLEALDTTIRSCEEAEASRVCRRWRRSRRLAKTSLAANGKSLHLHERTVSCGLVAFNKPRSPAAESYRSLRTSLLLCGNRTPPKVLAITSSLPAEGKTLTAVNCATVLAQQGASVLLVDADLRQPSLHQAFGIPQAPGLSDILTGACTEVDATVNAETMPRLAMLASGAPLDYPAEMLASPKMLDLIEHWRSQYDHVVIDTPPVSMFTEAVVLGSYADAVLLVARANTTTRQTLCHTRDVLQRANVNVAGVVVNGVDLRGQDGYYSSYGFAERRGRRSVVPNV